MSLASAPPPPNPLSAKEPWDLVSEGYAAEAPAMMGEFARRALELSSLPQSARVLDVAAGSGVLTLQASLVAEHVDAVDFSPRMLQQLQRQRDALGVTNVTLHQGDGQALPLAGQVYDAAFSMFGLMFFPDRNKGFSELFRCLKPGGVAVVSSWAPVALSPLMQLMFDTLRAVDPSRAAPQTNLLSLENPDVFGSELKTAGFVEVNVMPHTHSIEVTSAENFWSGLTRGGAPFVLLRKRLGEEEWQRQSSIAVDYLKTRISDPVRFDTTAYLGFGRRPR